MGESSILRSRHRLDTPVLVLSVSSLGWPRTHWLKQRRRFAGDFLAGITVASMLIPQSVSYASSLAKLSPVTGLVCPKSLRMRVSNADRRPRSSQLQFQASYMHCWAHLDN